MFYLNFIKFLKKKIQTTEATQVSAVRLLFGSVGGRKKQKKKQQPKNSIYRVEGCCVVFCCVWLRGLAGEGGYGEKLITPCTDKSDKDTAALAPS